MSGSTMMLLAAGLFGTLTLLVFAFTGPSTGKTSAKRLEIVRERHSKSSEIATQAQLKRIFANRQGTRVDGFAQRFIPNPALLRKRLEQTGRSWTLGQYAMASAGLGLTVMMLLWFRGAPLLLAVPVGAFAGLGIPHFVIGKLIQRRVNQFTSRFPDAIELMVR